MVAFIAFSSTNDSSYVRINTSKIWEEKFNVCLKYIKLNKHRNAIISFTKESNLTLIFVLTFKVTWYNNNNLKETYLTLLCTEHTLEESNEK